MVDYHVLKTHSIAARYRTPSSGEWDRVVEIESFRGNPPVPVTAIREECFSGAKIGLVTLPMSVKTIEARAFFESTVTSIVTTRTPGEVHLKEIGSSAFRYSSLDGHLRLVCDQTLEIGPDAFHGCGSIEEIEIIGSGTVKIHPRAFMNCIKLRVFRSMDCKITSLPDQVFAGCSELHTVAIPSLRHAGPRCCAGCRELYGFPAFLDSSCANSFEGCTKLKHPVIRKNKHKCTDDTLTLPTLDEIQTWLETNDIPGVPFKSFHKAYSDRQPIFSLTTSSRSGSETPALKHPFIKGYFRSNLVQKDTFQFEITVPHTEDVTLTVTYEKKFNPFLTYLANSAAIVQLTGMESENGERYNVFEMDPGLTNNGVLTPAFFREVMARLTGSARTDFVIDTADQARLYLKFTENTGLIPDNIIGAIRRELQNYETQPQEIQKHRLEALRALTAIDFNPSTKLEPPPLDSLQHSFDKELGSLNRVKQIFLSAAASIRETGKMPARRGIVLIGSPGTGKTHITRTFAKQSGLELIQLDFSAMDADGADLMGSDRKYSNGTYSLLVQRILQTTKKEMRALIDIQELDKGGLFLQNVLLSMLDGSYYDSYLQTVVNCDQLFFVATANSIENISKPLLSRLKCVYLDGYTRQEKRNIMHNIIVPEANIPLNPGIELQGEAVELMLDMYSRCPGVREIKNAVSDLVDAFYLECQKHPEMRSHRRTFSKSDIRKILGPSLRETAEIHDPSPGEVSFLYIGNHGEPRIGTVQVTVSPTDNQPRLEILGATGSQFDHVRMAVSASKTALDLHEVDLTIAFPDFIQSQDNVVGLAVYMAIHGACREASVASGTVLIGSGIDLFGNAILVRKPMTSLLKTAIDMKAKVVVAPRGFSNRIDLIDLDTTPVMIESDSCCDLTRFIF